MKTYTIVNRDGVVVSNHSTRKKAMARAKRSVFACQAAYAGVVETREANLRYKRPFRRALIGEYGSKG